MSSTAVVIGSDRLGLRVAQQLERDGAGLTLIALPGSWLAEARLPAAWRVLRARPDADVLQEAGLSQAATLLAVSDVDEVNLGAALAAREAHPQVRLILRQFNTRLAPLLARHLPEAEILSLSALAAPTFALAALTPGVLFAQPLGDETLVLRELEPGQPAGGRAVPLASAAAGGVRAVPAGEAPLPAVRLLVAGGSAELPGHVRTERPATGPDVAPVDGDSDRRLLGWTLAALGALLVGVSALFSWRLGLSALDALYFVSTILTTVGFGDYNLRDADRLSKIVGILAMFAGLFLTALLVGLLTSRLLARREARRRGHYRQRLSDHVVVCGLGTLGLRVAEDLLRRGVPVVVVEPAPRPRLLALARAAGARVVEGDGLEDRALLFAGLPRARSLVVATGRDHLNLEIALAARGLVPDIPLTLRLFDADLARRVRGTFGVQAAFSGATLTAGRFTSPATGGRRLAELTFAGRELELHGVSGPGSVGELAAARRGRAVAVSGPACGLLLDPPAERAVAPEETLVLLLAEF